MAMSESTRQMLSGGCIGLAVGVLFAMAVNWHWYRASMKSNREWADLALRQNQEWSEHCRDFISKYRAAVTANSTKRL